MHDVEMVVLRERAQLWKKRLERAWVLLMLGVGDSPVDYSNACSSGLRMARKHLTRSSYNCIARSGRARRC